TRALRFRVTPGKSLNTRPLHQARQEGSRPKIRVQKDRCPQNSGERMSTLPEPVPHSPENSGEPGSSSFPPPLPPEEWVADPPEVESYDNPPPAAPLPLIYPTGRPIEPELFASYSHPAYMPPPRTPNFGDLGLLLILLALGWLGAGSILLIALHFHVFGISTLKQAVDDFRYT